MRDHGFRDPDVFHVFMSKLFYTFCDSVRIYALYGFFTCCINIKQKQSIGIVESREKILNPGDIVMTLGAGNIGELSHKLASHFND